MVLILIFISCGEGAEEVGIVLVEDTDYKTTDYITTSTTTTPTIPVNENNAESNKLISHYSCNINSSGSCIFTGSPHQSGLKPETEEIINRDGDYLFSLEEAVAVDSSGRILDARGTPAFEGDELIKSSKNGMTNDEKAFHHVMAIMFPIRNALMYDIYALNSSEWKALTYELEIRGIKEETFTVGATPKDNYYGRQGVYVLAKNPGRDIHHDIMKFLEEAGLFLLCHVTSDEFNKMLKDTHPEKHDPCIEAKIQVKLTFND